MTDQTEQQRWEAHIRMEREAKAHRAGAAPAVWTDPDTGRSAPKPVPLSTEEAARRLGLAAAGADLPAPAHSKSEYKRRSAMGDPNVLPPAAGDDAGKGLQAPPCAKENEMEETSRFSTVFDELIAFDEAAETQPTYADAVRIALAAKRRAGGVAVLPERGNTTCNPHPDAPHGFNRNASHSAGRYVCDCDGWMPPAGVQGDGK